MKNSPVVSRQASAESDVVSRPPLGGARDRYAIPSCRFERLTIFGSPGFAGGAVTHPGKRGEPTLLDTDYNDLCFYAAQVFFPRTSAWSNLKKSLGASFDNSVWDHLAGTVSEPFAPGEHRRIAVKVIDERGNELMVVKLTEA